MDDKLCHSGQDISVRSRNCQNEPIKLEELKAQKVMFGKWKKKKKRIFGVVNDLKDRIKSQEYAT